MNAKPDLRVFLKRKIAGSGAVITDVITLNNMANKLPLATTGMGFAAVVHSLLGGNIVLATVILISVFWLASSGFSRVSQETDDSDLNPMDRLMTPFEYLATLDTRDVDSVGRLVYEELDLDARSELSEDVLLALVESQDLPRNLASRIRQFRASVISKIDARVESDKIATDPQWQAILNESRMIRRELLKITR